MAITGQVVAATPNRITFLLTHDGNAGDAITITAANMIAAAQPGAFKDFLNHDWGVGNDQANARLRLLGEGAAAALGQQGAALEAVDHCRTFLRQQGGITSVRVDADVDGVTPGKNELNVSTSAGNAGTVLLDVEYQHTLVR
jgi:hypothetical protein